MTTPTIATLPSAPNRGMSTEDFIAAADAFLAALPPFATQANALAAYIASVDVRTVPSILMADRMARLGTETFLTGFCNLGGGTLVAFIGAAGHPLYKSTDNGATWAVGATLPAAGWCMTSLGAGSLLAGIGGGICKSTDSGTTWTNVLALAGTDAIGSIIDMGSGVILAGSNSSGVYKSIDSGATWAAVAGSLPVYYMQFIGGGIVVGISSTGINRSSDSGATWTSVFPISGILPKALLNLGSGLIIASLGTKNYISTDSGITWTVAFDAATIAAGLKFNALAKNTSGVIFAGASNGKIYKSTDNGTSWTPVLRVGMSTSVGALCVLSDVDNVFLAGTGPYGEVYSLTEVAL